MDTSDILVGNEKGDHSTHMLPDDPPKGSNNAEGLPQLPNLLSKEDFPKVKGGEAKEQDSEYPHGLRLFIVTVNSPYPSICPSSLTWTRLHSVFRSCAFP
jgi:hypothetical protein